jgi:hypothetical protein
MIELSKWGFALHGLLHWRGLLTEIKPQSVASNDAA